MPDQLGYIKEGVNKAKEDIWVDMFWNWYEGKTIWYETNDLRVGRIIGQEKFNLGR